MSVTVIGLDDVGRAFKRAADRITPEAKQVVSKGALNIKRGMARDLTESFVHGHAKRLPLALNYDVKAYPNLAYVEAEIGPDKSRSRLQGPLANFLAFGSVNNAPQWDHAAAMEREAPALERYLADAADRLLT